LYDYSFAVQLPSTSKPSYGSACVRPLWIGIIVTLNLCASAIAGDKLQSQAFARWPDTLLARLEAQALIETLNARLLAALTATEVLEKWCADHKLASEPLVHARLIQDVEKPISPEQRQRLQIGADEEVTYRHVELTCGGHILAEADNWYVPSRVGADINRVLTTTDTPFGRAVQRLKPVRKNLSVEILWKPLPEGWELKPPPADRPGATLEIPWQLFQHRAVIYSDKNEPFSEVREIFTREVLAFGPP
jgi:chorismate-pyruvate lyase